jgi:hypothetical protein
VSEHQLFKKNCAMELIHSQSLIWAIILSCVRGSVTNNNGSGLDDRIY